VTAKVRLAQPVLIASTLAGSRLEMQAVHELGHVLAGLGEAERVEGVNLHPLGLSRTDVTRDRCPLRTIRGGPAVGVALPFPFAAHARTIGRRLASIAHCFARFCLVANGVHLGVGTLNGVGDAGDLICIRKSVVVADRPQGRLHASRPVAVARPRPFVRAGRGEGRGRPPRRAVGRRTFLASECVALEND